ncbi:MAG: hypothetical protein ACTSUE_00255 [Promethearchaeota archaeon]
MDKFNNIEPLTYLELDHNEQICKQVELIIQDYWACDVEDSFTLLSDKFRSRIHIADTPLHKDIQAMNESILHPYRAYVELLGDGNLYVFVQFHRSENNHTVLGRFFIKIALVLMIIAIGIALYDFGLWNPFHWEWVQKLQHDLYIQMKKKLESFSEFKFTSTFEFPEEE